MRDVIYDLEQAVIEAAKAFYHDKTMSAIQRDERLWAAVEELQAAEGE
jgi:hypothetical protein